MTSKLIYLDYAAATPLSEDVVAAMEPFLSTNYFNPSATYSLAVEVRRAVDEARARVAYWLGAKPSEVIFTAGATEANNLAITGIMKNYPEGKLLVSSIEHESVIVPAENYDHGLIEVLPDGRIDLEDLKKKIDPKTVLVSIMQANNEIGVVQPIREAAKVIAAERRDRGVKGLPIYLHTDSAQAGNYLDLHTSRLGVDLMSLNGGKIYGPKQTGVLYVKTGVNLNALIYGGGQERNLRSGTENVAGVIGLSYALDAAQASRDEESRRLTLLRDQFIDQLIKTIPSVCINGSLKYRLPNNIHLTLPGVDNERLLIELDQKGIMAAAGSACSASSEEPSHVLKALGLTDEYAQSSIRFSIGRQTDEADVTSTIRILGELIDKNT
jgi:cysteine desulfurase